MREILREYSSARYCSDIQGRSEVSMLLTHDHSLYTASAGFAQHLDLIMM